MCVYMLYKYITQKQIKRKEIFENKSDYLRVEDLTTDPFFIYELFKTTYLLMNPDRIIIIVIQTFIRI